MKDYTLPFVDNRHKLFPEENGFDDSIMEFSDFRNANNCGGLPRVAPFGNGIACYDFDFGDWNFYGEKLTLALHQMEMDYYDSGAQIKDVDILSVPSKDFGTGKRDKAPRCYPNKAPKKYPKPQMIKPGKSLNGIRYGLENIR